MHDLLVTGARVLDPGSGFDAVTDVAVRDGEISEIWPGLAPDSSVRHVDGTGLLLVPGQGPSLPAAVTSTSPLRQAISATAASGSCR